MRGNQTENHIRINQVILTLIVASLVSIAGLGQTSNAIVSGTVKDQSSRIIPGVGITITNTDKGTSRTTVSDDEGRYTLPELAPGTYQIAAGLTGFQSYIHSGIILSVGQHAVVNVVLNVGTYYVLGHFHYLVAPGTIFAIFAGVYHWYPRITGRQLNGVMAHLHFWPTLIFMNAIFFSMLLQGLAGVSRRLYDGGVTYAHAEDVLFLNEVMTLSAFGLALSQAPFLINLFRSAFAGKRVDENPWDATTLEWADPPDEVFRGPYVYGEPLDGVDFMAQHEPEGGS